MEKKEAIEHAQKYCAFQERCQQEVRNKLYSLNLPSTWIEEIISLMIEEGFLNEERFATQYTLGKLRIKHWGRIKIEHHLKQKQVSDHCILRAFKQIEENQYNEILLQELEKKWQQIQEVNEYVKKDKVSKYLISKGFEPDKVWKILKE